jgi:cardiolipin synthase
MPANLDTFITLIALFLAIWSGIHVILNKREPRGAALWLVIIVFIPIAGPFLYWVLGINRIKRKSRFRTSSRRYSGFGGFAPELIYELSSVDPDVRPLGHLSAKTTQRPLLKGNWIEPLYDGEQVFPSMLEAIGGSQRSVTLSTYILDRDAVGLRVIDSLCAAADRGCQVRVLVDGLGTSRKALRMASSLREADAKLAVFHPLYGLPFRRPGINMRIHRKILVVDGKIGFTGGINISSRHFFTRYKTSELVRDIHFKVAGPIVSAMQEVFSDDWLAATGEILDDAIFFSEPEPLGNALIRAVASGPAENFEKIYEIILGALRTAREEVFIMTPYFIPDRALIQALRSAVLSGVEVRILLPEKSDHLSVQWASTAYLPELLEAGVSIALIPPPFIHSKLLVVDRRWSLVGSANLDPRSFRLNFEFDLEVYNHELAEELVFYAENLMESSEKLTVEGLTSRSLSMRLLEGTAKLFSPYL